MNQRKISFIQPPKTKEEWVELLINDPDEFKRLLTLWQEKNQEIDLDLSRATLCSRCLIGIDLQGIDLSEANLIKSILSGSDLRDVNIHSANLQEADIGMADLRGAKLNKANLYKITVDGKTMLQGSCIDGAINIPESFIAQWTAQNNS